MQGHRPQLLGLDLQVLENPALPCVRAVCQTHTLWWSFDVLSLPHWCFWSWSKDGKILAAMGSQENSGFWQVCPESLSLGTVLPPRQRSHGAAAGKWNCLCQVLLGEIRQQAEFQDGLEHQGLRAPLLPVLTLAMGRDIRGRWWWGATGGSFSRRWMQ